MAADTQGQDPKALWQDQELETDPVTLEHVHDLARRFDRKTRFTPAVMALGLVFVGFLTGELWTGAHDPLQRVGAILFVVGQLGCYFLIYRIVFPSRDPAAPVSAHLRHRLQRVLSYRQGGWAVVLLPLLPFLLVGGYEALKGGHGPLWSKIAPFLLFGALLVVVAARARTGARQTRTQLQELDELLRSGR
jgi:hypothetical protein